MRSKRRPLVGRRPQARHVRVLQVADAAVNHLEALGGRGAAEIRALDQCSSQAAQSRVACGRRAERACADDQNVELFA